MEEIEAAFQRIHRPLRWPLGDYRRRKVLQAGFTGYVFSRVRGKAVAGFAYGFALRRGALPGIAEPPEAVAYVFVRPVASTLYGDLVTRPRSAVRRLIADGRELDYPFEFHPGEEVVAVRHRSFSRVPRDLFALSTADFFMIAQRPLQTGGFIRRVTKATERRGP